MLIPLCCPAAAAKVGDAAEKSTMALIGSRTRPVRGPTGGHLVSIAPLCPLATSGDSLEASPEGDPTRREQTSTGRSSSLLQPPWQPPTIRDPLPLPQRSCKIGLRGWGPGLGRNFLHEVHACSHEQASGLSRACTSACKGQGPNSRVLWVEWVAAWGGYRVVRCVPQCLMCVGGGE